MTSAGTPGRRLWYPVSVQCFTGCLSRAEIHSSPAFISAPSPTPEVLSSAASIVEVTLGRLQAPLRARRSSLSPSCRPFSFFIFFLASFSHFSNTFTTLFDKRFDIFLLLSLQRIDAFWDQPPSNLSLGQVSLTPIDSLSTARWVLATATVWWLKKLVLIQNSFRYR